MSLDYSTRAERLLKSLAGYDSKIDPRVIAQDVQKVVEALLSERVSTPDEACSTHGWLGLPGRGACPDCTQEKAENFDLSKDCTVEDFRRITEGYLNSYVAMALFSEMTLIRASQERARVVVKKRGGSLRVSLHRQSGEVKHYNRDGKP